jgi:hypothetical protein
MSLGGNDDEEGMIIDDWLVAQCKFLAKKGDIGLCKM